jgi:NAD(P)-dependent dehydrogenase (short-subunit alcohol dehydrogenase family)
MAQLSGKIALVTGAGRGIGFEIARGLGRAGARVVMVGRNEVRLEAARARLAGEGMDVVARVADVSDADAVADLVAELSANVDVLINNAGQIDDPVPTWEEPVAVWDDVLAANLRGPFLLCRALVPGMRARNWGRIVNVSSGMGAFSDGLDGGHPAYRVSKAGLNAFTMNLAAELRGRPILVNALCPGWVQTEMGGPSAPRSVEQGADTAIYLATLPDDGPSGKFFRDRLEIPW